MLKVLSVLMMLLMAGVLTQRANLIASKEFEEDYVVEGRNLTVVFTFHNIGDGDAFDIKLEDKSWPNDTFQLIEGSFEGSIDRVMNGENGTFTFVVVPIRAGDHKDEAATFTYQKSQDAENVTTAYTSFGGTMYILSENEYQSYYAEHTTEWIIFIILASIPIGLPFLLYNHLHLTPSSKQSSNKMQ